MRLHREVTPLFFTALISLNGVCGVAEAGPLDTLQPGQWYMAPNTKLSALDPCPTRDCSYSGTNGQEHVMGAWSGGAYDTKRDRLIVWGGGHNNYGGNEIYTFDIATLAWTMEIAPTVTTPTDRAGYGNTTNYYHDGRPASRHSASALTYAANVDQFFSMAVGATFGDPPGAGFDVDSFNFDTKAWKTDWVDSTGYPYGGSQATVAAYHPTTGHIWFHAGGPSPLMEFDPTFGTTGKWTTYAESQLSIEASALIDSKRNRFIVLGGAYFGDASSQFLVFDLNNPNAVPIRPATRGHAGGIALETLQGVGFVYDPIDDRYIAWNGGATVYALDPTSWVWSTVSLDSGNAVTPTAAGPTGTYGRMRYIPSQHAFIVVNGTTENVYFFKLAPGSTPLPTATLTASATAVPTHGASTLTWSSTNATHCAASNAWTGALVTSGTQSTGSLTATSTYTLACTGPGGSTTAAVTVTVDNAASADPPPADAAVPAGGGGGAIGLWEGLGLLVAGLFVAWRRNVSPLLIVAALCTVTTPPALASDLVNVTLVNTTSTTQNNGVVTFGHAFKAGDVPAGYTVAAKNSSGVEVALQVDKKATHANGSLRHAILTARLPSLAGNGSETLTLSSVADSTAATPVTLSNVLATRFDALTTLKVYDYKTISVLTRSGTTASATITNHGWGTGQTLTIRAADQPEYNGTVTVTVVDANTVTYPITGTPTSPATGTLVARYGNGITYTASARTLLQTAPPMAWLSGPLVSEWIVGAPVKKSDGTPHPHLTAYFHIRAYAGTPITKIRVDAVVENNWTLVTGPADQIYDATLSIGGTTTYDNGGASLRHYAHARWHHLDWWNNTDPKIYAKLDVTYLQDSKAIPKYAAVTITDAFLNAARQSTAPLTNGDQTAYMDAGGGQDGIAPLPRWDAVYAVSGDQRAFNYMKANSDGGAAYSLHYRDENNGYPITIDNYPNADLSGWEYATPLIQRGTTANPYTESGASSHQPSIGYLPYLVTGDYFYLEEMHFWSAYSLAWTASYNRGGADNGFGGNGSTGIFYTQSLRGRAWAYRSVGQAAAITPDSHALKSYFTNKLLNNLAYDVHSYVSPGVAPEKTIMGTMRNSDLNTEYRAWQDDFFTGVMGMLVDLGFTQAVPVLNYKVQNTIGRMGEDATHAYCFQFGPQYQLTMGPTNTTFYSSWAQVYAAQTTATDACGSVALAAWMTANLGTTYVQNQETGYSAAPDGYYSQMQPALAAAVQSGATGADNAWAKSQLSAVKPDYTDTPQWAIIPRSAANNTAPAISDTSAGNEPGNNPSGGGGGVLAFWEGLFLLLCATYTQRRQYFSVFKGF